MRPTILDIARIAGVSRTTVSNVMNGNGKCTQETLDKVLRVAAEIGYRPNYAARSLVNQKSNMIGLVLPSYADSHFLSKSPFYSLTIEAINTTLRARSEFDLLINCVNPGDRPQEVVEWTLQRNLAGLIFVGDFDEDALVDLDAAEVPMAFIDYSGSRRHRGIFVDTDQKEGARLGTRHLVDRGCRKIACCSSNTDGSPVNRARFEGYREVMEQAGLDVYLVEAESIYFESGLALAGTLTAQGFDGVFAVADALALGITKGLLDHGVGVPSAVKVVGFDNLDAAAQARPELTSVDQAIYAKGRLAIESLTAAIAGGPRSSVVPCPVRLVVRESSSLEEVARP